MGALTEPLVTLLVIFLAKRVRIEIEASGINRHLTSSDR